MKSIWKFNLPSLPGESIEMPEGAEILTVQTQGDSPMIWAMVDPQMKKENRFFVIIGTGHTIPDDGIKRNYIGTYQQMGGALVWHLFEIIR